MCPHGYRGETCDEAVEICTTNTCQNGGTCIDGTNGYVCHCPFGYTGQRCEIVKEGFVWKSNEIPRDKPSKCRGCLQKAGNGECNEDCNTEECNYDGGDCSITSPFKKCVNSTFCARMFRNGVCNEVCNNEDCLFDGFDCITKKPVCPAAIAAYCKAHKGDGICDEQCNQEGCDFDGGDCREISHKILSGDISVVVLTEPSYFVVNIPRFLRSLSKILRAEIRIKRDQEGPMIFLWQNERKGDRLRIEQLYLSSEKSNVEKRGIIVWIEVDVAGCVEECFSDVEVVANFIDAAKEKLTGMNMSIHSVDAKNLRKSKKSLDTTLLVLLACIAVMIAIAIVFIIHERPSRKRKIIENAPVWMPPTELEVEKAMKCNENTWKNRVVLESSKRRRMDPAEMKLLEQHLTPKTLKNRVFVQPKEKRAEPAPSSLHVEALSDKPISVPICTEDVNRRGPFGRTPVMVLVRNTVKTEKQILEDLTRLRAAGADLNLWDACE
ncbi:unnamed protein product [Cylicostephanus goldi]|uniref:EGF-like domain-containing protein n=1 Tax=Cylicostephanus goldi TaxID=71465 RepID=A0A3P6QM34_CYLGO|nr:unnamed protein product [Cylicostephanus goldi]